VQRKHNASEKMFTGDFKLFSTLLLRIFKCFMFVHFFHFILLTITVIACSVFFVCCKYLSLSVSLPFW